MTEVSVQYIDQLLQWYQSASALTGLMWIERDGVIVGGSQVNPTVAVPAQTGDTLADLNTYILAALLELTGDAPSAYSYPGAIAFNGYGTDTKPFGNIYHNRPFIAVASKNTYHFGALNIPTRTTEKLTVRVYIFANFSDASLASPSFTQLEIYRTAHGGRNPVLNVLELNAQ